METRSMALKVVGSQRRRSVLLRRIDLLHLVKRRIVKRRRSVFTPTCCHHVSNEVVIDESPVILPRQDARCASAYIGWENRRGPPSERLARCIEGIRL